MIVGSKKLKCQLSFELQSLHVFEKLTAILTTCKTPSLCNHIKSSSLIPLLKY